MLLRESLCVRKEDVCLPQNANLLAFAELARLVFKIRKTRHCFLATGHFLFPMKSGGGIFFAKPSLPLHAVQLSVKSRKHFLTSEIPNVSKNIVQ